MSFRRRTRSRVLTWMLPLMALVVALAGPARLATATDLVGGTSVADNPALVSAVPPTTIPSGVLVTGEGRQLWARDLDVERAMASTTKIMTALVVLDEAGLDDTVTISAAAAAVKEMGVDIVAGERRTVRELLTAMLVHSGNDAAFALAEHVAGSESAFVELMNRKAASLGLVHTSFANAHGLDEPGHYTTAADLATMAQVGMADPRFAEIVGSRTCTVTRPGAPATVYENSNVLIESYPGATGVKTGWTDDAGYCVVASATRGEISLVAVVLGATSEDDRFVQARRLLDWGFEHYALRQVTSAETTAALVPVTDYLDVTVPALVAESASVRVFDLDGAVTTTVNADPEVTAPVRKGQRLGSLTVTQGERLLAEVPLVAASDVAEPDLWERVSIWFTRLWRSVFGGARQAVPVMVS